MTLLSVTRGLLYILIFSLPLFALPFTLDALEINKQTLLVVLTFAAALTWVGSMFFLKRFLFRRGWLNCIPLLFLVAVGLSAWNSSAPFLSWVGGVQQEYTSFLTFAALVILFYLIANTLHGRLSHRFIHFILLLSTIIVGCVSLVGLFLGTHVHSVIGTINASGVFLVTMCMFALALWISHRRSDTLLYNGKVGVIQQWMIVLIATTTFGYLLLVDYWLLWMLLVVGLALMFAFVLFRSMDFPSASRFMLPAFMLILAIPFWFWLPGPMKVSIPSEVSLNLRASQEIAFRALNEISSPFGSGPGTYVFLYARHHSPIVNQTEFFNTRFDRGTSFLFTMLPTIGYAGFIALILMLFAIGARALSFIARTKNRVDWLQTFVALIPWSLLLIAAVVYHFNITLVWLLFLFGALLASQVLASSKAVDKERVSAVRLLSSFILTVGALAFLVGIFVTSQRYVAEIAYARAIRADREGTELSRVVALLDRAATLNRFDDRAYRVLSRALLLRVNEQMKAVSLVSELTDESRAYVQGLVGASINASIRATELSPDNILNWLARGAVYRELMPVVPNAVTFSINAIEKGIELEPLNPSNWTELGITYLAAAERERPLTVAKDPEVAQQANALVADFMNKAEATLNKAIELKANFAPAHYQLSLAYERQGRLDDAIGKMESVARYNLQDVGVAFQIGQLYMRRGDKGDLARARSSFEYAISLAPSYSNARWFLASIYEQEGMAREAVGQIEKVLELNPDNQLVKARLDRLLRGKTSNEIPSPLP